MAYGRLARTTRVSYQEDAELKTVPGTVIRMLKVEDRGLTITAHHIKTAGLSKASDLISWANARYAGSLTPTNGKHPINVLCEVYWSTSLLDNGENKFSQSKRTDEIEFEDYIKKRKGIRAIKPVKCVARIQSVNKIPDSRKYQIAPPLLCVAEMQCEYELDTCNFRYFVDTSNSMAAYGGVLGGKELYARLMFIKYVEPHYVPAEDYPVS